MPGANCVPASSPIPIFDVWRRAGDGTGAALGRMPLMEASANRPMTLTNAGFVALPE